MDKIAVIGISVELPSGIHQTENLDHDSFFQFLLDQKEAFELIPSERLNIEAWHGKHAGHIHTTNGAFLKNLDMFDNVEFGISAKDAQAMAISTRKLIELSFLALLDSGINYRSQSIGCYASGIAADSLNENIYHQTGSFAGPHPSMIANRISQHLDLTGPSIPIDTACSSSGAALHIAMISLLAGDCSAAVVAGAQINTRFWDWFGYSQGSILSPDGRSKPFEASADGFSRAEGVVAIVLKLLDTAIKDSDYIYGTILASAITTNGSAAAPGAPVAEAQEAALKKAFKRSGRTPQEVDYVECHATGTSKGDPVEANNIGENFQRSGDLFIGSVKGNIGHTEITSFLASFSKVLSMLEHQSIPPNVKLQHPNPAISWDKYRLRVAQEVVNLSQRSGGPSLISISSSGIGGANVHVIVEGAPTKLADRFKSSAPLVLFLAGGLSPRSATSVAESLPRLLQDPKTDVASLATRLGRQSRQMTWRAFTVVDCTDLSNPPMFPAPILTPRTSPPIIFVFSGQGPQHPEMGRVLFQLSPIFRESVQKSDMIYKDRTGHSMIHDVGLFGKEVSTVLDSWPIAITLPALTIFQIALFDLLSNFGVTPNVVIGHSAGEVPALYASGAASRELVVELAIARGEAFTRMESYGGTMAALTCSSDEAETILRYVRGTFPTSDSCLEVACYNSRSAVAIAGHDAMVDQVLQVAKDRGIDGRKIRTRVPVHSSMMEHCREEYVRLTEEVFSRHGLPPLRPHITTFSTLTGSRMTSTYDAQYFWDSTRNSVRFVQAMDEISAEYPNAFFVEISPHPVLSAYISSGLANPDRVAAASLRPTKAGVDMEYRSILVTVGALTVVGYNGVDFSNLNGQVDPVSVHRSTKEEYPFQKKLFPIYFKDAQYRLQVSPHLGSLNHPFLHVNQATHPKLAEHVVLGEAIMPAAGFLEMAFELRATSMINVKFRNILPLSSLTPLKVDISLNGPYWSVRSLDINESDKVYADGFLSFEALVMHESVDINTIRRRCDRSIDGPALYASLVPTFEFGTYFQRAKQILFNKDEALIELAGTDSTLASDGHYIIHPAILDSSFHFLAAPVFTGNLDHNDYYLPSGVARVIFCERPSEGYFPNVLYAHGKLRQWVPNGLSYDITYMDSTGKVLLVLEEFELSCRRKYAHEQIQRRFELVYEPQTFDITARRLPSSSAEEAETLLFWYRIGEEETLQALIAALDPAKPSDVWIAAEGGRDTYAARGLVRSLRHEFPVWFFHFISFPTSYAQNEGWKDVFNDIPPSARTEDEIVISPTGEYLIPRLNPIPLIHQNSRTHNKPPNPFLVKVISSSSQIGSLLSFVGEVEHSTHGREFMKQFALGVMEHPIQSEFGIDHASFYFHQGEENWDRLSADIGGMVVAPLALGLSTFQNGAGQCGKLHVLLTHSDSDIGKVVRRLYEKRGVKVTAVDSCIDIIGLSRLQIHSFDAIISGHSSNDFLEVAKLFTRNGTGRVYSWSQGERSLPTLVKTDPVALQEALRCSLMAEYRDFVPVPPALRPPLQHNVSDQLFRRDKSYLLLGGIGSLGPHIALWMYQNGARNITLASRTMNALQAQANVLPYRVLQYLRRCDDLNIVLELVDGTDYSQVKGLIERLPAPLGGCFLLMTSNMDAIFTNLKPVDFSRLYNVTLGAFDALASAIPITELDFVVAFSSTTALFGNGGQTNYSAYAIFLPLLHQLISLRRSKTALEGVLKSYENAFSFICPAVTGTSLTTSTASQTVGLPSQVPISDVLRWLDDGMRLHMTGTHRFDTYIPDFEWKTVARAFANGSLRLIAPLLPDETQELVQEATVNKAERLRALICGYLGMPEKDLSEDVPLISYGLDSLSSSRLSLALNKEFGLKITQIQLLAYTSTKDIYRRLESVLDEAASAKETTDSLHRAIQAMQDALTRHSLDKPSTLLPPSDILKDIPDKAVILSGATGSLGCHLLSQLIGAPDVRIIYALNRGSPGTSPQDKQAAALEREGLPPALSMSSKLVYLACDYDKPMLGLTDSTISLLSSDATHIIHNAWVSDFVVSLPAYEKLIERTRDLIGIALKARPTRHISFCFISTTGVCRLSDDHREAPIPLSKLPQIPAAFLPYIELGYIQSKWIAEQLTEQAASYGLQTSVLRVGQLAGSVRFNGAWASTQWFPAIVKSAELVQCLPSGEEDIAWLAMDSAASAVLDLYASGTGTYHVVHPRPVAWNTIMSAAASAIGVPLVPYSVWYRSLREKTDTSNAPGSGHVSMKFIDYFGIGVSDGITESSESMGLLAKVNCKKAQGASATLSSDEIPALGQLDVVAWIEYWRRTQFL
ncbi:hypothetical protein GALMADRAFT_156160 [Galerina marginata CBS 339.88]|uniref:Uncharacterized protein n=1 Tax=Galerina marginata (strain CBS 339.88) TaxID=685588 RepID=A0A067T0W7_GALM3|nr:hypothetical protein GALMADRAFT_156160 [Galerina marginata CBS 339.88]